MARETVKVRFIEVGRNKLTWTADVPAIAGMPTDTGMTEAVRDTGAILSRHPDFEDGAIFAGLRQVGRYEYGA